MTSEVQPGNSSDVENRPPTGKGRRASSRDMQSSMDSRLAKCELAMDEMRDRVEDTERGIEELAPRGRSLRVRCKVPLMRQWTCSRSEMKLSRPR